MFLGHFCAWLKLMVFDVVIVVNYDDDESRDTRSRRRMTDDDDTVLDNASVNSQDGNNLSLSVFHFLLSFIHTSPLKFLTLMIMVTVGLASWMDKLIEHYLFIPHPVTLTILQGHESISFNWKFCSYPVKLKHHRIVR